MAGAAVYTAYRDSETIFSSKDLASGVYELWQKKGATNIAEVRIDFRQGLGTQMIATRAAAVLDSMKMRVMKLLVLLACTYRFRGCRGTWMTCSTHC